MNNDFTYIPDPIGKGRIAVAVKSVKPKHEPIKKSGFVTNALSGIFNAAVIVLGLAVSNIDLAKETLAASDNIDKTSVIETSPRPEPRPKF